MTRFDADTSVERRKLFADAVTAHRQRGSPFVTVEPASAPGETGEAADEDATEQSVPWIQFAEQTVNLDCTDAELERLKDLLNDYPEFRIDQLEQPEDAEGTNVRITARADANRLAGFFDRVFQAVYGYDEAYRAWVVEV